MKRWNEEEKETNDHAVQLHLYLYSCSMPRSLDVSGCNSIEDMFRTL